MTRKPRLVVSIAELAEATGTDCFAPAPAPVSPQPASAPAPVAKARAGMKPPNMGPLVHCLEYDDPTFREPQNGELVVGLYREDDGTAAAVLLWADPRADLFRDVALGRYVRPPKFYLRLKEQPQIDPGTAYPIIEGAVCPF